MLYELVSEEQFASLPLEPAEKWLALEAACRRSLKELTTEATPPSVEGLLRMQYMNMVASAAEELGVEGVKIQPLSSNFESFLMAVSRVSTRLRLKVSGRNHALSVSLPRASKSKLFAQIERLRQLVRTSGLNETQQKKLFRKLDELHEIIIAPRTDYAKLMAVVAFIAAGLGGATAFLADAPDAIATITAIVGDAKEQEEDVQRLLQSEKEPLQIQDMRSKEDGGDETPF